MLVRGLPPDPTRAEQLRAMVMPAYKLHQVTGLRDTPPFWTITNAYDFQAGLRFPMAMELLAEGILPEEVHRELQCMRVHAVDTKNEWGPPFAVSPSDILLRHDLIELMCDDNAFEDLQNIPRVCKQSLPYLCHRQSNYDGVVDYTFSYLCRRWSLGKRIPVSV
jgi:hypothetical protein